MFPPINSKLFPKNTVKNLRELFRYQPAHKISEPDFPTQCLM